MGVVLRVIADGEPETSGRVGKAQLGSLPEILRVIAGPGRRTNAEIARRATSEVVPKLTSFISIHVDISHETSLVAPPRQRMPI